MSELPNLRTVSNEFRVFLDQDDTLAPSNAFNRLYDAIGNPEQLVAQRNGQREHSREATRARETLIVPPYDIVEHLGPEPDPSYGVEDPYNLSEEEIIAIARQARENQPSPLFPDAQRLLGRLASRSIVPTILTYGEDFTQRLKGVLNGLDEYPFIVVQTLKSEYLKGILSPGVHIDDRAKHVPVIGEGSIIGVLYAPQQQALPSDRLAIQSHDELWR